MLTKLTIRNFKCFRDVEVELGPPKYNLDLSCAGRSLHQTLLLPAHVTMNPGAVLLLDEPDAHPEILRQRRTYQLFHKVEDALRTLGKSPWSADVKASDEFLDPLFQNFFDYLDLPNQMRKSDYHVLARYLEPEEIDPEVVEVLDAILQVVQRARPVASEAC